MAQGIFNLKQVNQAIRQDAWTGIYAPKFVEYLVVAGGGSGGYVNGGGGGAGGLLTGIVPVTAGSSYTVTVGAGGTVTASYGAAGNNGSNSVFGSISSTGGGGGAGYSNVSKSGGSGGGGSAPTANASGSNGTSGQGNAGGNGQQSPINSCGGGGGAGTIGINFVGGDVGGNGGAGIASAISGTVTVYAGGGAGSGAVNGGTGGSGGGGGGGFGVAGVPTGGAVNTGTGGGGDWNGVSTAGAGGSGIVVVRYPGNIVFYTGGTVNYNNGYISHIFNSNGTLAPTTPAPYNTSYQISRSLRFNRADTNTLTRTPATAGSRTTYSLSFWVKNPFTSGNDNPFWGQFNSNRESLAFSGYGYSHNPIVWIPFTGFEYRTTQGFRDNSAWYHVVAVGDSSNATAGDRARLYINGSRVTDFATSPTITQNSQTGQLNTAVLHYIGQQWYGDGGLTGLYLTEMHFIDGQALTPSSFGATSTTTGVWAPIKYTGTYGTNGFYLNFSDNSNNTAATLGKDYSGNGNNWTPNNFSVTAGSGNDSLVDTPTPYGFDTGVGGTVRGNYCTFNPLAAPVTSTVSDGNLFVSRAGGAQSGSTLATIGVTSGKYYWEIYMNSNVGTAGGLGVGIVPFNFNYATGWVGEASTSTGYWGNGAFYGNHTGGTTPATYTVGDTIGIALDMDALTVSFYKNGVATGGTITGIQNNAFPAICMFDAVATSMIANFGQRPFAYTAPTGFKALCTQNLPEPAIGGSSETLANEFFGATTYTGNSSTQSIVNSGGFQPDWVWIKGRSGAYNHQLFDAVRGVNKTIYTNLTNAEFSDTDALTAFNSNGFTLGAEAGINYSSETYVAWQWKAGNNAGVSNYEGIIPSKVSANPRSGFSIVTYTGTGSNATVGHGLGVEPSMIIVKIRNTTDGWFVYHKELGNTKYLRLNTTAAETAFNLWQSISPTSRSFRVSTDPTVNGNTNTYVAYCFAPVAGYSAFGKYTGNGSTDGTFVFTGFRPAFVMVKASFGTSAASANWLILDTSRNTYNEANNKVAPNLNEVENGSSIGTSADNNYDLLSNGFKARTTNGSSNESGTTFIYMAFAENPFKYSLAR